MVYKKELIAEAAMRVSEERFQAVAETTSDAIISADSRGNIVYFNKGAERVFGYSASEVLGKPLTLLMPERFQDAHQQGFKRFLLTGETRVIGKMIELVGRRKNGTEFPIELSLASWKSDEETFFTAIIRDITERKRAEEVIKENLAQIARKSRYETIIRNVTQSVHQSINLQDVLENAVEAMSRNIDRADYVSIYLVEEEAGSTGSPEAVLKAHRNFPHWYIERAGRISYPKGFTWKTIIEGKSRYVMDIEEDTVIGPAGKELGIKSYLSIPLRIDGKAIGALNINSLEENSFDEEELNLLEIVVRQIETAINNARQAEVLRQSELLHHLAEGTASVTGADFFKSLVHHLASALHVRYVFATQCTDATLTSVRTLAFWMGKDFGENFEYALAGTPCENVIAGNVCLYPKNLQMLFPKDEGLVEWQAESFLGIPIRDSWENVLGHLAAFDDKPMDDRPRGMSILQIFAARAGAELERKRAEEKLRGAYDDLRRVTAELRALLDVNRAISRHLERDALFGAVASCLQGLLQTDRFGIELPLGDDKLQGHLLTPRGGLLQVTEPHVMLAAGTACSWVIQNRQWFVTASREELRESFPTTFHVMTQEGMESLCAIPLLIGENCRGAFFCMAAEEEAYRDLPQALLEKVAVAVAVALDNCLAHEEVRRLRDRLAAENVYLQEEIKTEYNFEEIIGQSTSIKKVLQNVEQVSRTDATVLIMGETGTGKELVSRAIHNLSPRKDRPLVKVNCGAISAGLVESELFGHERGAFTGALQKRVGRFELADGGTIFLDEVSELPLDTQVKLLRVLQEGEFERVGSSKTIKIDVRVIAATNRNLTDSVKSGSFRSDLFYRLNVFPLEVPPLRERKSDILLLTNFFLTKFSKKLNKQIHGISKDTMDRLMSYPWPGNIRELENVIERAVVLSQGPKIEIDESLLGLSTGSQSQAKETLEDVERGHIIRVLDQANWVINGKGGAASMLGINPNTLRSRMQKLGIKRPRPSANP